MSDKKFPQFTIPSWLAPHMPEIRMWGAISGPDLRCWVEACDRSPHLHGLCRVHYFRAAGRWKPSGDGARSRGRKTDPGRPSRRETGS